MAIKVNGQGAEQAVKTQAAPSKVSRKDFLEAFKVLPESRFRTTSSGLKVAVLTEGKGKPATNGMRLKVEYTGWLQDGKQFDTSVGKGKPFEFSLGSGQVIKGWEEGLAGMKPGERRQLIIPASLAYGGRQMGKIPPDSVLIFNIEAIAVDSAPSNPKSKLSVFA